MPWCVGPRGCPIVRINEQNQSPGRIRGRVDAVSYGKQPSGSSIQGVLSLRAAAVSGDAAAIWAGAVGPGQKAWLTRGCKTAAGPFISPMPSARVSSAYGHSLSEAKRSYLMPSQAPCVDTRALTRPPLSALSLCPPKRIERRYGWVCARGNPSNDRDLSGVS